MKKAYTGDVGRYRLDRGQPGPTKVHGVRIQNGRAVGITACGRMVVRDRAYKVESDVTCRMCLVALGWAVMTKKKRGSKP